MTGDAVQPGRDSVSSAEVKAGGFQPEHYQAGKELFKPTQYAESKIDSSNKNTGKSAETETDFQKTLKSLGDKPTFEKLKEAFPKLDEAVRKQYEKYSAAETPGPGLVQWQLNDLNGPAWKAGESIKKDPGKLSAQDAGKVGDLLSDYAHGKKTDSATGADISKELVRLGKIDPRVGDAKDQIDKFADGPYKEGVKHYREKYIPAVDAKFDERTKASEMQRQVEDRLINATNVPAGKRQELVEMYKTLNQSYKDHVINRGMF